jgi:hypothetical protein
VFRAALAVDKKREWTCEDGRDAKGGITPLHDSVLARLAKCKESEI